MSLSVLNSTAYVVYTPVPGDGADDDEEDEEQQVEGCQQNLDRGTSICTGVTRITEDGIVVQGGVTPDVEPERFRRHRVHRAVFAVLGSATPPPRGPVPGSVTLCRRRGTRHGIRGTFRVRMDTSTTRFVRVWAVAQNDRGQILSAMTFLFELRRRRRGSGLESFRLIERGDSLSDRRPSARESRTTLIHDSERA